MKVSAPLILVFAAALAASLIISLAVCRSVYDSAAATDALRTAVSYVTNKALSGGSQLISDGELTYLAVYDADGVGVEYIYDGGGDLCEYYAQVGDALETSLGEVVAEDVGVTFAFDAATGMLTVRAAQGGKTLSAGCRLISEG